MWKTRLTSTFPCELPIMAAPMADVSGGLLAAEVSKTKALPFLAAGHLSGLEELRREVRIFQRTTVSLLPSSSVPP